MIDYTRRDLPNAWGNNVNSVKWHYLIVFLMIRNRPVYLLEKKFGSSVQTVWEG